MRLLKGHWGKERLMGEGCIISEDDTRTLACRSVSVYIRGFACSMASDLDIWCLLILHVTQRNI